MNRSQFEEYIVKKYDAVYHSEDLYYLDNSYLVYIRLSDDKKYSIFSQFTFPLKDYEEYEGESEAIEYELNYLNEVLSRKMPSVPVECFESGLGCPFDDVNLGYFELEMDNDLIDLFIRSCDFAADNRPVFSENNDLYDNQLKIEDITWHAIESVLQQRKYEKNNDMFHMESHGIWIVKRAEKEKVIQYVNEDELVELDSNAFHKGFKYVLLKTIDSLDRVVEKSAYNELKVLATKINEEDKIKMKAFRESKMYFETPTFVGIFDQVVNTATAIKYESDALNKATKSIDKFKPFLNSTDFNFKTLSYTQFESLIADLLSRMGFIDIHPNGGVNASDGGIDIFANKLNNINEVTKYLIQCKYSINEGRSCGFNRKDAGEVKYLLREKRASRFIVFTNTTLSPSTIDRIHFMNELDGTHFEYYQKDELCRLLRENRDIAYGYGLIK